ncbi:MAG: DsbA family protein [Deltaproteobacteria bacterium]|nr:DsbA family protein [Deltaproteobacteria bacterium]
MLELWFDFSCPYAYLASRQAASLGVEIDWRPMLLGGVFRGTGAGDGPNATLSPPKAAHNYRDMHRWADVFGHPFRMPSSHPMRTVRALRVLLALPHSRWPFAIAALYATYWERAEDITRDDVIATALRSAGTSEHEIAAALAGADGADIKDDLRRRTDEAISLGIFGAPAWVIRRPSGPLLIWGQDRLDWVRAACAGWNPDTEPPHDGPRTVSAQPAAPGSTLDVYFDVSSPFAYLGLTQLPALARHAGITPRLVPILLGALFRDIHQAEVPWFAMPPAKQRYVGLEMSRWARWWGQPFDLPTKFPQRTVTAQRLCILAAERGFDEGVRLAILLGRAMWAEQQDLEDAETLRRLLAAAELPVAWVEQTQDPAVKAALVATTASAREHAVFGVPTFVVNGTHLFWGQDRLELVARALAGWTPKGE